MKVWIDGKFYEQEDAKVSVFDHGLLYGDGVFEGIRAYGGRVLHLNDHISRLYSKDMYRFGAPPESPDQIFKKNVWVSPFFEDDVPALVGIIGAERVLAGSDYPHPEGLADPLEFLEELEGLESADVQCIMRDNFESLVA